MPGAVRYRSVMSLAPTKLGTTYPQVVATVDPDRARAYAAATNDNNPAYRSGAAVPPVFAVVPTWAAMTAAVAAVVPAASLPMTVHAEHDMHLHRPLEPGQLLVTTAEAYSLRVGRSGTRYTIKVTSVDGTAGSGEPVLEQYATLFVRGLADGAGAGPDKPPHAFPHGARARPVGTHRVHVDDDQTFRYSGASGDHTAIHVDEAAARSVGLPGIIVHGLCTMAMTGQSVVETVAGGDPTRLQRLAVRFSRPVFPGNDLITSIFDAGEDGDRHVYAFEAHSRGEMVISNGRASVAP